MKTILVVYLQTALTVDQANNRKLKKYCFKTEDDLKVGDVIRSKTYSTDMLVTDVIDKEYSFYNSNTSSLSTEINSTSCYPIKTLCIREEDESIIYAKKVE